ALTIANMKNAARHLSRNQMIPGTQVNGGTGNGGSQPPRNRMAHMAHMVEIATYSPSMNIMYGCEPYSTMKPATSSDSASTRSNGGRFVSASAEMKNTTNIGSSHSQYHPNIPQRLSCAWTMAERLSEPTHSSTVMMTKPMETS